MIEEPSADFQPPEEFIGMTQPRGGRVKTLRVHYEHKPLYHTYHKVVSNGSEVAYAIENFFLNFGCLVSITVVPIFNG